MDSRIIEYLVHNLSNGTQFICRGRKNLFAYAKEIDCCIDKNKLSRVSCLEFPTDGELVLISNKDDSIYCIEELLKWKN